MPHCRYEQVDTSEYASMFKWYLAFEEQTFGQPPGLRDAMRRWSLGLYPGVIKAAMAVFDVVESIAVSRTRICTAGGLHALTRVQVSPTNICALFPPYCVLQHVQYTRAKTNP